jgi:hypothetical protein
MPRRPPRDPTKPPPVFTTGLFVALLLVAGCAAASRALLEFRLPIRAQPNGSGAVLLNVDVWPTNLSVHEVTVSMRVLCRDGSHAEHSVKTTLDYGLLGEHVYMQVANSLDARLALEHTLDIPTPVPFLGRFNVGYYVQYLVQCGPPVIDLAVAEADRWIGSGQFRSSPICGPIPLAVSTNSPSGQWSRGRPVEVVYEPVLVAHAALGMTAIYAVPVVAFVFVKRGIHRFNWRFRFDPTLCYQCKYPMTGIESGRCPECGTPRVPSNPTPTAPDSHH